MVEITESCSSAVESHIQLQVQRRADAARRRDPVAEIYMRKDILYAGNRNVGGGLRSQRVLTNGDAQRRTVLWRGRAILSRLDTPEALMRRCMRHRASDNRFRFLGTDVGARMV